MEEASLDVAEEDGSLDISEVVTDPRAWDDNMFAVEGSWGEGFGNATVARLRQRGAWGGQSGSTITTEVGSGQRVQWQRSCSRGKLGAEGSIAG